MKIGYYVFFGNGDYHPAVSKNEQWFSDWGLKEWKKFIDKLITLNINTLMIYLNGHKLPYKSTTYPKLVDTFHPNYKKEFLADLLNYAKIKGLELIAVLTTTGHAGKFSELNHDSMIEIPFIDTSIEDLLVSFPEHLRTGKSSKKDGAAQIGYGVLCHNKKSSRDYAVNIISELISLYGKYFDAVALHPPESLYPCICHECESIFHAQTNKSLKLTGANICRQFFIKTYLKFQNEVLFSLVQRTLPETQQITFTIPWLFEKSFDVIASLIPQETVIIEWDYNLDHKRISSLNTRLSKYMSLGNSVWFMPTAGFSFNNKQPIKQQINAVQQQLKIAEKVGIKSIIHFLGPKESQFLVETSMQTLNSKVNKTKL